MVTQDEDKLNRKRLKHRNKIIQADIQYIREQVHTHYHSATPEDDIQEWALEAYHLGMDTGIKIGKDEL